MSVKLGDKSVKCLVLIDKHYSKYKILNGCYKICIFSTQHTSNLVNFNQLHSNNLNNSGKESSNLELFTVFWSMVCLSTAILPNTGTHSICNKWWHQMAHKTILKWIYFIYFSFHLFSVITKKKIKWHFMTKVSTPFI